MSGSDSGFGLSRSALRTMRLCCGKVNIDEIREGVSRLTEAVKTTSAAGAKV